MRIKWKYSIRHKIIHHCEIRHNLLLSLLIIRAFNCLLLFLIRRIPRSSLIRMVLPHLMHLRDMKVLRLIDLIENERNH